MEEDEAPSVVWGRARFGTGETEAATFWDSSVGVCGSGDVGAGGSRLGAFEDGEGTASRLGVGSYTRYLDGRLEGERPGSSLALTGETVTVGPFLESLSIRINALKIS